MTARKFGSSWTEREERRRGKRCVPKPWLRLVFGADWREMGVSAQHHPTEGSVSAKKGEEMVCFPRRRSTQLLTVGTKWKSQVRTDWCTRILPIRKLIVPADQRRPKPLQMQSLSLDLQLRYVSGAIESAECLMLQTMSTCRFIQNHGGSLRCLEQLEREP